MSEDRKMDAKVAETLKTLFDSLTEEQKQKAKACRTMDELMALAGKEGIELPDEALDAVAGAVQAGSILTGGAGEFSGYDAWKKGQNNKSRSC